LGADGKTRDAGYEATAAGVGMKRLGFVAVCAVGWALCAAGWSAAQEEEEPAATPKVTEAELQLYIDVYSAMQADHSLTIEEALLKQGISLEKFRELERRIQGEQRLVEKVRLALLNQARSRSLWAGQPTPSPPSVSSSP